MGTPGIPLKKHEIIEALIKTNGVIRHAAEILDCHKGTLYGWINIDQDVADAVKEGRENAERHREDLIEEAIDEAYKSLMDLLLKRDVTATIFTLKYKGNWERALIKSGIGYLLADKGSMDAKK